MADNWIEESLEKIKKAKDHFYNNATREEYISIIEEQEKLIYKLKELYSQSKKWVVNITEEDNLSLYVEYWVVSCPRCSIEIRYRKK